MKSDDSKPDGSGSHEPASGDSPSVDAMRADLVATAYHEAGHAVMAFAVGRPIHKVTISPAQLQTGGWRAGACRFDKGRRKASKDWLEDEVLILLAGMVAEGHVTDRHCRQGAAQDLRAVRQLLASRATSERQRERLERRLLDKAEHLLAEDGHTKAIELIAKELLQHQTISGRAVRHLYQQAAQQMS